MINNDLTREQWIDQMERGLARTMPDMYPPGFARFEAEKKAEEGGYDNYCNGAYGVGKLWEPNG